MGGATSYTHPLSRRHFVGLSLSAFPFLKGLDVRRGAQVICDVGPGTRAPHPLEQLALSELASAGIPGLSLAAIRAGREVWSGGVGFADLEHNVRATADTVYRIASVSKPITATAVMQLREKGKLDLDAPIQRYVPSFPEKPWPITARQLLEHTAGIRHYSPEENANRRRYQNLTEALEAFKNDALLFQPGTSFRYSSYGFVLLGAAVEGAAGMSYSEYVRIHLLDPSGMRSTRPDDADEVIPHRARGYRRTSDGTVLNATWVDQSNKLPAGGWLSTVADLARFAAAIEDGRLLSPRSRAEMWRRVRTSDGREMDYAKGWMTLLGLTHRSARRSNRLWSNPAAPGDTHPD